MGGCATKPRELKEEEFPQPAVEDKAEVTVVEKATETEADDVDDSRRKSLGQMFKESEESKVTSETEEVAVKETITPPAPVEEEEEQPKAQETPTVEKFVTPAAEESTAPSETTVTTEEKQVDSSPNVDAKTTEIEATETTKVEEAVDTSDEQKEAAPTEEANAELSAPLSTEKVIAESPKAE